MSMISTVTNGQEETCFSQYWVTGEIRYPVDVSLLLKGQLGYRSVYDAGERWRAWNFSAEVRYSAFPTIDLVGALRVFYTNQNDTINSTEIRPTIGATIDIIRRGRFIVSDYVRYEWQHHFYNFSELNETTHRLRNKIDITFSINKKQPSYDKALNIIISYEAFIIRDDELKDRFSNRRRFEGGLSYRFNKNWRFNMSYYRQNSRNQIESSFDTRENILALKATYVL